MFEHLGTGGAGSAALRAARALESASGLDSTAQALLRVYEPFLKRFPRLTATLHGEPLGHPAHPLMTDVTIGLWTSASVLDVVGGPRAQPAADRLIGLGVLAFFPTATAGWADWSVSDQAVRRVGLVHAIVNGASVIVYGTSWALRKADHRGAGVALSLGGAALMTVAGYLGGHMAYRLGAPTGGPEATERPWRADDEPAAGTPTRAPQEARPAQL